MPVPTAVSRATFKASAQWRRALGGGGGGPEKQGAGSQSVNTARGERAGKGPREGPGSGRGERGASQEADRPRWG